MESRWAEGGTLILKFWLHLDGDEQLRRFEQRQQDPHKQWKITAEDWRNRENRSLYERAVETMFERTDTQVAPWTIVESNCKLHARIKVLRTVVRALRERL
jgi:polyphosphate kinase 2 (PPK2 family)